MKINVPYIKICFLLLVPLLVCGSLNVEENYGESVPPIEPILFEFSDPSAAGLYDPGHNIIIDSLGTLDPFLEKLASIKAGNPEVVSILHIGDSHVQAGFWTGHIRKLFQNEFGNAGRGLIVPHKLTGSNEPTDYWITTPQPVSHRTASLKASERVDGPTGKAITFETSDPDIFLRSKEPFNTVTVIHHPATPQIRIPDYLDSGLYCTAGNTELSSSFYLSESVDSVRITSVVDSPDQLCEYYGYILENGEPGVLYHSAGINGAAFEHWMNGSSILTTANEVFIPDLIIISLGTNNCYGNNFRVAPLEEKIGQFAALVKENFPSVPVIMTTPPESCKRTRSQGRIIYTPNDNIAKVTAVIRTVCQRHDLACWDLYHAMGGKNSNEKWTKNGMFGRDRIHLQEKGYVLQAEMLYDALIKHYNRRMAGGVLAPADPENLDPVGAANNDTEI